jgi:ribosome-binding factor A
MSQRSERVAEELRKIISKILLEDVSDPGIGFVTITRIELTEDLRFARVFYSVLGDEAQKKATQEAIDENAAYIRHLAIERINMKYAIDIRFEMDKSIDQSFQIDQILKKIKKEDVGE